jgi:hypothetical protein
MLVRFYSNSVFARKATTPPAKRQDGLSPTGHNLEEGSDALRRFLATNLISSEATEGCQRPATNKAVSYQPSATPVWLIAES